MKRSRASCAIPDFELPVDPDFQALAPAVNLRDYCRLNSEFRKQFPEGVPSEQERLARKIAEEFKL